ncbi:MAG: hypothetical protein ACP6IY_10055 [Promethearchaeia archaeon]
MQNKNRMIVALFVILGAMGSLVAGGVLVVTRTYDITKDKAMYFQNEYTSKFDVYVNNNDKADTLTFKSEKTDDSDIWKAVIKWDDKEYSSVKVSDKGLILDSNNKETDKYFFLWWEEEELTLANNINRIGQAIISTEKEKEILDPYGLFLNASETYIAECKNSLVYLKGRFATQASFEYVIYRKSDGKQVGHAIIDMTSGIAFELYLYEDGFKSVSIYLKDTSFIISRNRYRLLTAASIILPITAALIYLFFKKRGLDAEELKDCTFLGTIGCIGVWIDQFFDFWFTTTDLMPIVIAVHFIPIALILIFKRELWHFIFIPLLELALFGLFIFFNMGLYVLWLVYGNFMLFLALLAYFRFTDTENKR